MTSNSFALSCALTVIAHNRSAASGRIRVTLQDRYRDWLLSHYDFLAMRPPLSAVLACSFLAAAGAQNLTFGDREARRVPEWLNTITIYELWPNAFSTEGTLRGAIPGLKRIADLGASVIYLGPIAKHSNRPYTSPYNISDYNAVDP